MRGESDANSSYELVVRGELDERYGYLFDGMHMTREDGTTVITGAVRDRAQLYGHIERIEELGLELLSVQQTAVDHSGPERERETE
jgi:hypothetical protein